MPTPNIQWNRFILENPTGSFLSSWDWGTFQKQMGRRAWYLVLSGKEKFQTHFLNKNSTQKNTNWLLLALVIKHELPFGRSYFYLPRGPIVEFLKFGEQKPALILDELTRLMKSMAKHEKAVFFRIDPEWGNTPEMAKFFQVSGFQKSRKEVQPRETRILDIYKSEKGLLEEMHQKTRYNIRLAEKKGVHIRKQDVDPHEEGFEEFWKLMQGTAKRDGFKPHPREYYERMLTLGERGGKGGGASDLSIELFTAEYEGSIIAGAITAFFGKRATYLHGVSSQENRNVMASYLLHWEIIKEAKRRGCTEYDFWGVSEKRWPGVTRFKRGFGGREARYIGAYDFVFDLKWYFFYNSARALLRKEN